MITYDILSKKKDITKFFMCVQDCSFDLRIINARKGEYYNSSQALQLLSSTFKESLSDNSLRLSVNTYFDKEQQGMIGMVISVKDEYTLHVERDESKEVKGRRKITVENLKKMLKRLIRNE